MKQRRYDTGVPSMQFRIGGNETVSRRGFHVKLYLGIYDFDRRRVRCVHGEDGGGDERGARVRRGRGLPLHHHDRRDGAVGGIDGDCAEIGTDSKADERDTTLHQLSFSAYPERASGEGVHSHELDCKCAGAWLGVYAGGIEGDGGVGETGGGERDAGVCGRWNRCKWRRGNGWREERETGARRQQRDVYVFDIKYFIFAADTGEYDCVPAAVREREPGGDYRAGDCGDVCQYGGGGGVL